MTTRFSSRAAASEPGLGKDELRDFGRQIGEITEGVGELVRLEVELAKAEFAEGAATAGRSVGFAVAAGMMAAVTVAFVLGAVMLGLANNMPMWGAALLTAFIALVLTLGIAWAAMQGFKSINFFPERTMRSIQEDLRWLRNPTKFTNR